MRNFTVAFAGGGASGTLTAAALTKRTEAARVVIVDPSAQLGRGVAYATDCPRHVLNVPAGKMSAVPAEPDHFVRWLVANAKGPYGQASFVPRSAYGDYLSAIAAEAEAAAQNRWRHVITAIGGSLRVPIKLRGSAEVLTVDAGRVINCSGPQHDFRELANPLIRSLLAQGLMVPSPLGIGVLVAENGALIGADSAVSRRLFAIGPARFGTLIETTAIPEIRVQAHELAESLEAAFVPDGKRLAG